MPFVAMRRATAGNDRTARWLTELFIGLAFFVQLMGLLEVLGAPDLDNLFASLQVAGLGLLVVDVAVRRLRPNPVRTSARDERLVEGLQLRQSGRLDLNQPTHELHSAGENG